MAADAWELRTARLEGAYEQVDRRLGAVEGRLATLEHKMDTGFAQVRAEISGLSDMLHTQISGLRDRLHAEISDVRDTLRTEISGVRDTSHSDITSVRGALEAAIAGVRVDMRRQFYWLLGVMLSGFLVLLKLARH
jgi:hypothetical protein